MSASSVEARPRASLRGAIGRSFGKWLGIGLGILVRAAVAGPLVGHFWKGLDPFGSKMVDRTGPALLQAVTGLHDYHAATGTFEVIVDVEKDAKFLPSAIRGEHTTLMAHGTVDAGVDLSSLDPTAILVDKTTSTVTLTLPRARLYKAQIDLSKSHVIDHKRGLLDRLGSTFGGAPTSDRAIFRLAETKLAAAARSSSIRGTAEANTRSMLVQLVTGLGFEHVTVRFADPVAVGAATPVTSTPRDN